MAIRTELVVRLQNSPGAVSRLCAVLAEARINVLAMSVEATGFLRAVVDNPIHAAGALRDQHYTVEERDVLYVTLPNEPGAGGKIARLIADAGVNIDYLYGSVVEGQPQAAVVIGVGDAARAAAAAGV
jgi:hypothetical protein